MDATTLLRRGDHDDWPKPKRPCLAPNLNQEVNSNPTALDLAFDRVVESRPNDTDKNDVIERGLWLGSAFAEAEKRSARRRATIHNISVWALCSDLTIKVFSLLDTKSVCNAGAACSFFHKCSTDPLCYSSIDLTSVAPTTNDTVVSSMILRAGKSLRSLKLGTLPFSSAASLGYSEEQVCLMRNASGTSRFSRNAEISGLGEETFILTRSCLDPLIAYGGAFGALLKRLHLYNIERMDSAALRAVLAACPALRDLEMVGLDTELTKTLESVSRSCPLIERLFFESSEIGSGNRLKLPTCIDLVTNCPCLSSLALRGFELPDTCVGALVEGLLKLKYIDFSTSDSVTGEFLMNHCEKGVGSSLEVLILRDCIHLREGKVARLLSAILAGHFTNLRLLDISSHAGLASDRHWYARSYSPRLTSLAEVLDKQPGLHVIANFPPEYSDEEEIDDW